MPLSLVWDGRSAIHVVREEQLPDPERVLEGPLVVQRGPVVELSHKAECLSWYLGRAPASMMSSDYYVKHMGVNMILSDHMGVIMINQQKEITDMSSLTALSC